MPSSFTWLDYSEHERRKMLDVIELFGERTTRDELGLGGVRADVWTILRYGSAREWLAVQSVNLPLLAATATRLLEAGRAPVVQAAFIPQVSPLNG